MIEMTNPESATVSTRSIENAIDLRSLCLPSWRGESDRLENYLHSSERERAARFYFQGDYDRYVVGRAFLRLQLGAFLNCDPQSLRFQYTQHGKPFIEDCGLDFNLSHSGDWVLFAFARSASIGVDIEQIRPLPDMRDVAKQNFATSEFARWQATPEPERTEAFYRCWTRKESFIKAIGEGLSFPLSNFEVAFGVKEPARLMSLHGDDAQIAPWWMADLPGFPGYAAAVTARTGQLGNVCLQVRELANGDLLRS